MVLFLAAITARLLSRILGALDAPFGPIVAKRGEAGAALAIFSAVQLGAAVVALSLFRSEIPRLLQARATGDQGGEEGKER